MTISALEMPILESVQRAHDELLANMPTGSQHTNCNLCLSRAGLDLTNRMAEKEVAEVADYTEEQHFSLLEAGIARETSALTSAKQELEAQVASLSAEKASAEKASTELQNQIDVLEAAKTAAIAETAEVQAQFDAFKNELAEKAEVEQRKAERVTAVQAANAGLTEEWCKERAQRWAELSAEAFEALLDGLSAVSTKETASTDLSRETSAFKGGESPSAVTEGTRSTLGSLFSKVGLMPTGN